LNSLEKSLLCAKFAYDKKTINLVVLELKDYSALSDYFIICSGTSDRHVQAIVSHIEMSLKEKGTVALGIEGVREGKWVLLDYDDVIIHVFQETEREFYDLESLWAECPRIPCNENSVV
jgi:ribosome-associated protein